MLSNDFQKTKRIRQTGLVIIVLTILAFITGLAGIGQSIYDTIYPPLEPNELRTNQKITT